MHRALCNLIKKVVEGNAEEQDLQNLDHVSLACVLGG
jgi:hypothetical protein